MAFEEKLRAFNKKDLEISTQLDNLADQWKNGLGQGKKYRKKLLQKKNESSKRVNFDQID